MADQRIMLKCKGVEIVIAVRHGGTWRSAIEDRNDIGTFLNNLQPDSEVSISLENERSFYDPMFFIDED